MAYQSKYTGLQIDDILDSVEWKQGKIEDLASIRAGAQKGATALQSYTEKYTGTVTGIKINGVVKSGSGVIDLGTISTDISGKQDKLVDGVNIATINGQSLTAGGDITIEGGAKVYEWTPEYTFGEDENIFSGTITQDVYNNLLNADLIFATIEGIKFPCFSQSDDTSILATGIITMFGATVSLQIAVMNNELTFVGNIKDVSPTKTSQLENDSNFITSEDVAAVALSGSYNDLQDTPTIPSAVTESTVSGWGFTKNTGTITGVSANGTSVATSGVANIPAASTSKYGVTKLSSATNSTSTTLAATASAVKAAYDLANGKQDKLVSGTNIKTINGTSILGSGDITIESGAKVYELDLTGRGNYEGYITEEEWNIIKTSDRIKIITDIFSTEIVQIYSPFFELIGDAAVFASLLGIQGGVVTNYIFTGANTTEGSPYSYIISEVSIPTQTSQLENDSNFVSSNDLKTINGQSIVGSGNLIIEGGSGGSVGNYVEKEVIGDTEVAYIQGFNTGNMVYGLPDTANNGDADDYLVSAGTLKTINGESLFGEGDITISGGSGSGAYQQINHGSSSGSGILIPNTFHVWDEVGYLELSLAPETSGVANEYLFQFTSGATATSLTLPDDIKWTEELAIEANRVYQVSILKGLASVLSWENASAVTLITFYYNGTPYQAEEGMTWAEFADSGYNSGGFYVQYGYVFTGNYQQVYNNYIATIPAEQIIANAFYDNNSGGGGGGN